MFTFDRWIEEWRGMLTDQLPTFGNVAVVFVVVFFLERDFGAEPGHTARGRLRNIFLGVLYFGLGYLALTAFILTVPVRPEPVPDPGFATSALHAVGYLLVVDLVYYWYHRAQHRFRFLWAIHELHHADAELNITTSYRTYWLENLVQPVAISLPVLLLFGQDVAAMSMYVAVATGFLLFTHSNLKLSFGPLSPILCGPQVHRIHHSRLPAHQDKNFAQIFPFYDVIFGTYWAPRKGEYPPTGTEGLASDASILRDLWQPLAIWGGMLRSAVRRLHRGITP